MKKSLAQTFNETAAAAHEAFPQKLKKLVILLVPSSDTPVYVSPEIADQLTKSTAAIKEAVEDVANYMQEQDFLGYAESGYDLAGTRANLIALDVEGSPDNFSRRYTKEMNMVFTLDHEIGHHILKNGFPSSRISDQLAESAADAYAMLRHIQRFGKNTDHAGAVAEDMAYSMTIFSDTDHYTTDSVQRAIQLSKEMDISGLSLRETARLAEKIADECHLNDKIVEKIRVAFLPVHRAFEAYTGADPEAGGLFYKKIISVMKKHRHDPDIFKAGKQSLSYPPIMKFMTEAAKTDPYWEKALAFIDAPETKASVKQAARGPVSGSKPHFKV